MSLYVCTNSRCSAFVINHKLGDVLTNKHSLIKELLIRFSGVRRREEDKLESLNQEEKLQR